jgi:hypothetical protein
MYYFLTEERSMEKFLKIFLDKIEFNEEYRVVPHSGKSDLKKSIPSKIRSSAKDSKFIILIDQDSNDCKLLKSEIENIIKAANRLNCDFSYKIRIVCHELESWYLGDLSAVDTAFGTSVKGQAHKRTYRDPDNTLGNPKQVLKSIIGEKGQTQIAEKMARAMTPEGIKDNTSHSFRVFVETVKSF